MIAGHSVSVQYIEMVFERAEGPQFQIRIASIINASMICLCVGWRSRHQAPVSAATLGVSIGVGEAVQSIAGKKAGICFEYPSPRILSFLALYSTLDESCHTHQASIENVE